MAVIKSDQGPIYKCDAPDCRSMRFPGEGEAPDGTNGTAQRFVEKTGVEVVSDFFACKDAHIGKAVKAVLDAEVARLGYPAARRAAREEIDPDGIDVTDQVDALRTSGASQDTSADEMEKAERELERAAREDTAE